MLDALCRNLYASGFTYCCDRDFVKSVKTPCLVLAGNDEAHPWPISEELSTLLPSCEFVPEGKTEPALTPFLAPAPAQPGATAARTQSGFVPPPCLQSVEAVSSTSG